MKRLIIQEEIITILDDMAKNNKCYWRYQDSSFGGTIPVGHKSHERMYETEEPEYEEDGVSCFDNPYMLSEYISNEMNNLDTTDVVLFVGSKIGTGMDDEDIVVIEEQSDIWYSLTLRDFCKWALITDYEYEDFSTRTHSFDKDYLNNILTY